MNTSHSRNAANITSTAPVGENTGQTPAYLVAEYVADGSTPTVLVDLLAQRSGLSKMRIKDAIDKGAVWLKRGHRKPQRIRRVTELLAAGDRITLNYDEKILATQPPAAHCMDDRVSYSVWFKPAGLMVEGSRFGDHATLARQVELHFPKRRCFIIHRLDREASGLMLVAHKPSAAARLSELFQQREIVKEYLIEVRGDLRTQGTDTPIDLALDGKACVTDYEILAYLPEQDATRVRVMPQTGRYHQIRRHFAAIGFPVLGDPKYGQHNSDPRGLRLTATRLSFQCPWTGETMDFRNNPVED
jgi:tRNA pseudouridine32 synthase/23S rRNA pseudouridine746 synthase